MSLHAEPMTAEQIQREAIEIWEWLTQLDRSKEARENLRRAGVAESRIRSLYPLCFADFIDELQPLISSSTLREITDSTRLQELMNSMRWMLKELPAMDRELALQLVEKNAFNNSLGSLCRHIDACLPPALADEEERAETARRAGILLWLAIDIRIHVFEAVNYGEFPLIEAEADWLLLSVAKALLGR